MAPNTGVSCQLVEECGLIRECGSEKVAPIPLREVNVSVRIIDMVAEVQLEQKYHNDEETPIEAVYLFPLDHSAAVHGFEFQIDDRVIVGEVKGTETAKKEYKEALGNRQTAALLTQVKQEMFKARIGNIPPGKDATIKITYLAELKPEDEAVRFYLPTTIAPRYIPKSDTSEAAKEIANISYSRESPAPLKLKVKVETKSKITKIESPSHVITHKIEDEQNTHKMFLGEVFLSTPVTDMDRDFVLLVSTAEPHKPRLSVEISSDNNTVAAMLTVVPSFELTDQKVEFIFIIDRSGSMMGESIEKAKEALQLFLHSLPVDCYINIVGFGSSHKILFPEMSEKYGDTILKKCLDHAKSLDANLGGTEIYNPLQETLSKKPIEGYLRQVFILTDGEVSNTNEVIKMVRKEAHHSRIFALGIGSSASHELVEGIARAGNGTAEFVTYEERLQSKVMKQLGQGLQPALSEVSVSWAIPKKTLLGTDTELSVAFKQAPFKVPPIFNGSRTIVYCICENDKKPQVVTLTAKSPDGPLTVELQLDEQEVYEGNIIHRLAARKLIQDLEDGVSWLGSSAEKEITKKEIVDLGCKYGVASSYTAFVAVDKTTALPVGKEYQIVSREVPSQVAAGWGGMMVAGMPRMMQCCPPRVMACAMSSNISIDSRVQDYMEQADDISASVSMTVCADIRSLEYVEASASNPEDAFSTLMDLQHFDGQFSLTQSLLDLLSTNMEAMVKEVKDAGTTENTWATAVAIKLLEHKFANLKESWELLVQKSMRWLKKESVDHEVILKKAEVYVSSCIKN